MNTKAVERFLKKTQSILKDKLVKIIASNICTKIDYEEQPLYLRLDTASRKKIQSSESEGDEDLERDMKALNNMIVLIPATKEFNLSDEIKDGRERNVQDVLRVRRAEKKDSRNTSRVSFEDSISRNASFLGKVDKPNEQG